MIKQKVSVLFAAMGCFIITSCASQEPVYQGQGTVETVNTTSKPVQKQWKGTFDIPESGLSFSNDFEGARLNGVIQDNDSTVTVLITSENTPINPSPWYAFKVWSEEEKDLYINLTYPESVRHRYFPKLSSDGLEWSAIDSVNYQETGAGDANFGPGSLPTSVTLKVTTSPDTLWIAGQELKTSKHVYSWAEELAEKTFISSSEIGKSRQGRPLKALTIGDNNEKFVMVISRQHPPEVTGYLAMQAFIETISSDSDLAQRFRENYTTLVVPLMNPDGVDNGHWRHNTGGIDLNRDWSNFNQPETSAVKSFMEEIVSESDGKFYFGIDFHSTWDDIYYTVGPELRGNMPGLVPDWLNEVKASLPNYEPNISPNSDLIPTTVSRNYFFIEHGAESLVYEVGDNTPRDFVQEKGEVSAIELMELMLQESE